MYCDIRSTVKMKGKVFLVHAMKVCRGVELQLHSILPRHQQGNVSFRLLFPQEWPLYPQSRRLIGPHSRSGRFGFELRTVQLVAYSPYRLSQPGSCSLYSRDIVTFHATTGHENKESRRVAVPLLQIRQWIGVGNQHHIPARLHLRKSPVTPYAAGDWVGLSTGLDGCGKFCSQRGEKP